MLVIIPTLTHAISLTRQTRACLVNACYGDALSSYITHISKEYNCQAVMAESLRTGPSGGVTGSNSTVPTEGMNDGASRHAYMALLSVASIFGAAILLL